MQFLDPMKVKEYGGQPISVAQVKFDGYYTELYKSRSIPGDGIVICHKKQNSNKWKKLSLIHAIRKSVDSLPWETILRCELHAFGVPATSVPTLTNNADKRLLLSPFKIEMWYGDPNPWRFREEIDFLTKWFNHVPDTKNLSIGECFKLSDEAIERLKQLALEKGIEGWVVKDIPGGTCWKIKPQKTVDAFVTKVNVSDSDTYGGGLKSVTISVYGHDGQPVEIGNAGSGFKGGYRMTVDLSILMGRVGEFKYQDVGAKGRLKFPRFLRWRDDEKRATECSITQLKGF